MALYHALSISVFVSLFVLVQVIQFSVLISVYFFVHANVVFSFSLGKAVFSFCFSCFSFSDIAVTASVALLTVWSVTVLSVKDSVCTVISEWFEKSDTIVEQHNAVDKLEQFKVVLR